jgi:hypothetical protein
MPVPLQKSGRELARPFAAVVQDRLVDSLAPPHSVIELTDESADHRPVSLFPGQHITGR